MGKNKYNELQCPLCGGRERNEIHKVFFCSTVRVTYHCKECDCIYDVNYEAKAKSITNIRKQVTYEDIAL